MATTAGEDVAPLERRHVLQDLGWVITRSETGLGGSARIVPEMHAPASLHLRTSILAAWADVLAGYLAVEVVAPRVPVTLELDVHLYRPAPGGGEVHGGGQVIKAGRTVFAAGVDFSTEDGEPFGFSAASFMAAPDARLTIALPLGLDHPVPTGPGLTMPFAERAGCERIEPGVAALSHSDDVLNASNTINGGLIALAAEEAVLSLSAPGATLSSLALRYLQPARVGPVVARADVRQGLGRVEIREPGTATACVRWPPPGPSTETQAANGIFMASARLPPMTLAMSSCESPSSSST
ncbi:MAG TPA: hotdog domain-containing protein [Acidimicrobiales bacterium]